MSQTNGNRGGRSELPDVMLCKEFEVCFEYSRKPFIGFEPRVM